MIIYSNSSTIITIIKIKYEKLSKTGDPVIRCSIYVKIVILIDI